MFTMISGKRCPACGITGKIWKKKPEVFICPICETIFNEFGFVTEPQQKEVRFA